MQNAQVKGNEKANAAEDPFRINPYLIGVIMVVAGVIGALFYLSV